MFVSYYVYSNRTKNQQTIQQVINHINGANVAANSANDAANSANVGNGANGSNSINSIKNALQTSRATPIPGFIQGKTPSLQDTLVAQGGGMIIGMVAEELIQKALGKAGNEAAEKAAKEAIESARESAEKAIREASEKTIKEAGEKAAKEAGEKAIREGADKATQEGIEKIAREAGEKAAIEGVEKVAKEAGEQAAQDTGERIAREIGEKAAKEAGDQAAKEAVEKAIKEGADKVAQEAAGKVAKEATEKAIKEAIEKGIKEATDKLALETLEKAAAADKLAKEVADKLAKEVADKLAKEVADKLAKEVADKLAFETAEMVKQTAFQAAQKAAQEAAEKFIRRGAQIKNSLKTLGSQLSDPKVAIKIFEAVSETGSAIKQLLLFVPKKGLKALFLAYKFGRSGINSVAKLSIRGAVGSAAVATKASIKAGYASFRASLISNPVGWAIEAAMLLFDVINAIVDAKDPNGYNLLDKWQEGSNQAKAIVNEIVAEINAANTTGKAIKYPSRVGPLDILSQMPKNCVESSNPFELPICPPQEITASMENIDGEDDNDEGNYLFDVLIPNELEKIFKFDQDEKTGKPINYDPLIQPLLSELFNPIYEKLTDEEWNVKEEEIYKSFKETNNEILLNTAFKSICEKYGGSMDQDNVCMFNKAYCINQIPTPLDPNNCKLIPDPDADKCNNPPGPEKFVCDGGDLYQTGEYDLTKGWSEVTQQCLNVNPVIKSICESNNLEYNVDNGMCIFTEDMCRSKAGTPKKLEDGTIDCTIPMGQMITEAVLGKTLTSVLVQTLAHDQYEKCKPGYIDAGKDGMMKDLNDLCNDPKKLTGYQAIAEIGEGNGNKDAQVAGQVVAGAALAHAYVLTGPVVATTAAAACAVGSIASYFCRKECGPGETDVAGVCWIDNPKVNDPPCDPGYKFDGVTTCTANNVPSALTLPIPNKCPAGYQLQGLGPLCVARHCKDGDKDNGLLCQEKCKKDYKENGAGLCVNNNVQPSISRPREKCAINYKFDGATTCWMEPKTATRGPGISPTECGDNANLVGITCWSKCDKDEVDKGATCESCPSDMINNGATTCYKKCDDGYEYDGSFMCNTKPLTIGGGVKVDQCPSNYKYDGVSTCWKECSSGEKDKGATCESCPSDMINNGASLCYKECDPGYTYDGTTSCNSKALTIGGGVKRDVCPSDYNYDGVSICWGKCPSGEKDKGATCESCDNDWINNGASTCYEKCDSGYTYDGTFGCNFNPETLPVGTIPNICPEGYNFFGTKCYSKTCDTGYNYDSQMTCNRVDKKIGTGTGVTVTCPTGYNKVGLYCYANCDANYTFDKASTCWANAAPSDGGVAPNYTCPDGYNLTGVTCQKKTTTATADCSICNGLSNVVTTGLTCSGWDGCQKGSSNYCDGGGLCVSETDLCARRTGPTCWWNCCGKRDWCRGGGDCVSETDLCARKTAAWCRNTCTGGAATRDCNQSCPSGYSLVPGTTICKYNSDRPDTIDATKSCLSNRDLIGSLCYLKCPDGYNRNGLLCLPPKGTSYIPNKIDGTYSCPTGQTKIDLLCYDTCESGYTYNDPNLPVSCIPNNSSKGLLYTQTNKDPTCNNELDFVDGLCYKKCSPGNTRVKGIPTQCAGPKGLNYITKNKPAPSKPKPSEQAKCKSELDNVDGLCYNKCPTKATGNSIDTYRVPGAPTQCQGSRGLNYKTETKPAKVNSKPSEQAKCKSELDNVDGLCYNKCPTKATGNSIDTYRVPGAPTQCQGSRGLNYKTETKPAKVNSKPSEAAKCKSELDNVDGLCYKKCPTKANGNSIDTFRVPGVPTNCQGSRGLNYETQHEPAKVNGKKSFEAECKSNREKKDSLCYLKCDDKYGECYRANPNAVTECMPKKGVSYLPNFADCPDGYTFDGGLMCVNSYVPRTYAKKTVTADCTGNRDQIAGSCYDKCPSIDDGKGGKIQLKHADGMPTQCVPPRGVTYPALVLSYVPETYAKKRAVAMSTK